MVITSLDNPKIALVAKLADKKYRKQSGLYVIEGVRLVTDAQKHGADIQSVFVAENSAHVTQFDGAIVVTQKVFAKMCGTVNSQGVLAVAKQSNLQLLPPQGNCLVLDGVQDPGNMGTLIRTAVACGFTDVFAVDCVDVYSPKVVRAAMSAHFCINLHQLDDMQNLFELFNNGTVITVCADMQGKNIFDTPLDGKIALVLGNEGNGVSQFVKQNAQLTLALPMENDFESLNVAVAGSVMMYQIYHQNKIVK